MCMREFDTLLRDVHYVALSFKFLLSWSRHRICQVRIINHLVVLFSYYLYYTG